MITSIGSNQPIEHHCQSDSVGGSCSSGKWASTGRMVSLFVQTLSPNYIPETQKTVGKDTLSDIFHVRPLELGIRLIQTVIPASSYIESVAKVLFAIEAVASLPGAPAYN